jgi:valyl-tRNA synthetase
VSLSRKYQPQDSEQRWMDYWHRIGTYHFSLESSAEVFSIDTPPPTVSGLLHLGHIYSYTHPDIIARFWRMRGLNVFYPMGFDDNGLPTERLVEKNMGITAQHVGREEFIRTCLKVSEGAEKEYETLWRQLGLSVDWRHTYRTIDHDSRRISQISFIELYKKELAYRQIAPAIWCPECQTSIAQAELNDINRVSVISTISFQLDDGQSLEIATTRPELLPACVALFVHPLDSRYASVVGRKARVPIFGQQVSILSDEKADPDKGTGAVMCCTFGDSTDVAWWHQYNLPLAEAIQKNGRMSAAAGDYTGLSMQQARQTILQTLEDQGLVIDQRRTAQSVRVHERCDTPVEYITVPQWFIRLIEHKQELLELAEKIAWHPEHMKNRYLSWVENLNWDWCISRQRYFGVPFPVWYCQSCDAVLLAGEGELPVDPLQEGPGRSCQCGSTSFKPETDVMDTWATSSMSPQIVAQWLAPSSEQGSNRLYERVFPLSLRPQAHEIIRTWAFYTLVKSHYQFNQLPWSNVLISGWGVAGEGMGKISKSRGGGVMPPIEMIQRYSADAVRYWAASTGPGRDSVISEEKMGTGSRLLTKLWNVARFSEPFLQDITQLTSSEELYSTLPFTPSDLWILARRQSLVSKATHLLENYEYASAKNEIENFFWNDLADNYLEMCKQRLYGDPNPLRDAARFTLYYLLHTVVQLFAPYLPFITEEIYQSLLERETTPIIKPGTSVHTSPWPIPDSRFDDEQALHFGSILIQIATAVRRYKSERNMALSTIITRLVIAVDPNRLGEERRQAIMGMLAEAEADLKSVTRAEKIELSRKFDPKLFETKASEEVWLWIQE